MDKKTGLPKTARRVFKGVIFDVYQWPQKMYDGSIATFERLKRPDTVEAIAVTKDKKIIILKQQQPTKQPFISLPGGRLDPSERPLPGIKRELAEETGYTAKSWRLLFAQKPYGKIDWTIFTFLARGAEYKSAPTLDSGEKITVQKMSFADFLNLTDDDTFREPHLKLLLWRARYNPRERAQLKKLLFG